MSKIPLTWCFPLFLWSNPLLRQRIISYQIIACLSTTFFIYFIRSVNQHVLQKWSVAASASYILPALSIIVNNFFQIFPNILFSPFSIYSMRDYCLFYTKNNTYSSHGTGVVSHPFNSYSSSNDRVISASWTAIATLDISPLSTSFSAAFSSTGASSISTTGSGGSKLSTRSLWILILR